MPILPDILETNLKVVFCGTAVSTRSAQIGAYYAGRGNQFWIVLHEIGLTPHRFDPQDYPTLPQYGIGLTDLVKERFGMDHHLQPTDFDPSAVREKILHFAPKVLAFNGKRAAKEFYGTKVVNYGQQPELLGSTAVFVLPSTSAAAYRFVPANREESYSYWRGLVVFLNTH